MSRVSDFVAGLLRRVGETIFRSQDEFGQNHGWQIEKGRHGLSRSYRHPGFDRLAQCPQCLGRGRVRRASCERCKGSGRITLGKALPSERR